MNEQIKEYIDIATTFLNLCEMHPAQANVFYQENQDIIDSIIQFHKDNRDRIKNLPNNIFLNELEKFLTLRYVRK